MINFYLTLSQQNDDNMRISCICTILLVGFALSSCIKPEALNTEADIESCTLSGNLLKSDPIIENTTVTLLVKSETDITRQAPEFTLTPGATISPASGTIRDFTKPQTYTVTSEDGQWSKKYAVTFVVSDVAMKFDFENVRQVVNKNLNYTYDVFYENDSLGTFVMDWASGNAGFALTGCGSAANTFPTYSSDEGMNGTKCAKLITRSTGSFGALVKMYIAAGNLFMGMFDISSALSDAVKATKLGVPFTHVPTYLKGYYKYKAGDVFKDKETVISGRKDKWDIYAIFFESDATTSMIDATQRFTHPNLISIAHIDDSLRSEANEWTEFYIPFITVNGKTVDQTKLKTGVYKLAIVLSSSLDGDTFQGAVGSTLLVDEIEVIHGDE